MKKNKILDVFKLEEIIDILVEYDLKHFEIDVEPIFGKFLYGYVDFLNKNIYISRNLDYQSARETIIHEFVHILKNKYGIRDTESRTERDAKEIYNLLYSNYIDKLRSRYIIGGEKDGK